MLGVKYDGLMLDFPNAETFDTALDLTNKISDWTVGAEGQSPASRQAVSIIPGFFSMNHQIQKVLQVREAAALKGELKESIKSEPIQAKFPAGQGLCALLNAEGVVKIQGMVFKFTADAQVLKQDETGEFIVHPEEAANIGGPKSLCCLSSANLTQVQIINNTDRMVARLQLFRNLFLQRFYVSSSSTYQRFVQLPHYGTYWFECVTTNIGVFLYGAWRATCSESSQAFGIPAQTYSVANNTHIASVSFSTYAGYTYRFSRLFSMNGCSNVPAIFVYAC